MNKLLAALLISGFALSVNSAAFAADAVKAEAAVTTTAPAADAAKAEPTQATKKHAHKHHAKKMEAAEHSTPTPVAEPAPAVAPAAK